MDRFAAGGFTGLILHARHLADGVLRCCRSGSRTGAPALFFRSLAVGLRHRLRGCAISSPTARSIVTYVFLALTILILESRIRLWLLPPLFLIWANCHAGFIMGWVVMGAYCGESLFHRLRGKTDADERRLWGFCLGSILISGLNPNGFNVIPVLRYYRAEPDAVHHLGVAEAQATGRSARSRSCSTAA